MHSTIHPSTPLWVGIVFLVLGIALLVASPKLVSLSLAMDERTNRWLLDLIGYDGKFFLSQNDSLEESPLQKWRRSSAWFGTFILSAMLITVGVVILQRRM